MNDASMADVPTGARKPTPKLNGALARVQGELPRISKDEKADIPGKEGKRGYSYNYADLPAICDAVLPLLSKNGLAFTAWPTLNAAGKFVMDYELLHESGEQKGGTWPLASSARPQDLGALITYYRRYAMCAVIGIAPGGEDNDAATANNVQQYDSPRSAAEAFDSASPARPAAPEVPDVDDGLNDDWLEGIDSQEAADKADTALRKAFSAGAIGPTKATRIRGEIQKRARQLAVASGPRRGDPEVAQPEIAALAAAAVAATDLVTLKVAFDNANTAKRLTDSFMHDGKAVTIGAYIAARRKVMESRETAGAAS